MRDQLVIQEEMDCHLNSRDKELRQLHSQSQEDGAQLAALLLQVQELISSVKERAGVVEGPGGGQWSLQLPLRGDQLAQDQGEGGEGEGQPTERVHHWGRPQCQDLQGSIGLDGGECPLMWMYSLGGWRGICFFRG